MKLVNSEGEMRRPFVWLEINRRYLLYNVEQMKKLTRGSKIMAVLKSNAYGTGCVGIAEAIQNNVDAFGVVGVAEALLIRRAGIRTPIINLGIYSGDDARSLLENEISPTIFTISTLNNFVSETEKLGRPGRVWVKVDTGLNRLGIPYTEASNFIDTVSQSKNISID